jgi:transposase
VYKAYSSRGFRAYLRRRGIAHTIPEKADQRRHRLRRGSRGGRLPGFGRETYRRRNLVERCFNGQSRVARTDVEALDPTAERLRHIQDTFVKAADDSRARADRYADHADGAHPVHQDDQQAHHPQPGPHRGREVGH